MESLNAGTGYQDELRMANRTDSTAMRIAFVYALASGIWLVASSVLVRVLARDEVLSRWIDDAKDMAFVAASALVLFIVLRRVFRAQARANSRLHSAMAEAERLAEFARNNPNPVLKLAANGDVLFANDAAGPGSGLESALPESIAEIVQECLSTGLPSEPIEVRQDGRTWRWQFTPSSSGEARVFAYAIDRTTEAALERQLMHAARMESAGRLAASVAHDFGNLLTVISGYGELLAMETDRGSRSEASTELRLAIRKSKHLIAKIMSVSRPRRTTETVFDLNRQLRDIEPFLTQLLRRDIEFRLETCSEELLIEFDVQELEQMLLNLLANAADAIEGSGVVTVTTAIDDRHAVLAVHDSGSGIAPEHLPLIFEPFFSTKPEGQGTGLGLASVARIMARVGATFEVQSEPGLGTSFSFRVPLCRAGEGQANIAPRETIPEMIPA